MLTHAADHIFDALEGTAALVFLSCLELYNERLTDLMIVGWPMSKKTTSHSSSGVGINLLTADQPADFFLLTKIFFLTWEPFLLIKKSPISR